MPELTRRRALLAAVSGAVSLAGCGGSTDRPTIDRETNGRTIEDYEVHRVRVMEPRPLFRERDEATPSGPSRSRIRATTYVTGPDDLTELFFGDGEAAAGLRRFATATDFTTGSVFLFSIPVDGCRTIRLQRVTIDENDQPDVEFCQRLRPADVECSLEALHVVGYAIRLPVAGDGTDSWSSGMSSQCHRRPDDPYFDGTVTVPRGEES